MPVALIAAAILGALTLAVIAVIALESRQSLSAAPISRVETADVHALAFLDSPDRVILGHHGGIMESTDGGRSWRAWGTGSDAMAMGVGEHEVIIAGHHVLAVGTPDGQWSDIENDLPSTDIHGFARDPHDSRLMWAYLATGGLFESRDGGAHWQEVFPGHTFALFATPTDRRTRLVALDPEAAAIAASDDGGRTWQPLGPPPSTPVYAMAGAAGGATIFFSGGEGLFRSDDGGRTFSPILEVSRPVLAIAASETGETIVVATSDRSVYRSDDGGRTWPGRQ